MTYCCSQGAGSVEVLPASGPESQQQHGLLVGTCTASLSHVGLRWLIVRRLQGRPAQYNVVVRQANRGQHFRVPVVLTAVSVDLVQDGLVPRRKLHQLPQLQVVPDAGILELVEVPTQKDGRFRKTLPDAVNAGTDVVQHGLVLAARRVVDQADGDVADSPRQALQLNGDPHCLLMLHVQLSPLLERQSVSQVYDDASMLSAVLPVTPHAGVGGHITEGGVRYRGAAPGLSDADNICGVPLGNSVYLIQLAAQGSTHVGIDESRDVPLHDAHRNQIANVYAPCSPGVNVPVTPNDVNPSPFFSASPTATLGRPPPACQQSYSCLSDRHSALHSLAGTRLSPDVAPDQLTPGVHQGSRHVVF